MKREELGIKIKILRCRFSARVRANRARQGRWPGFHVPSGARTGPGNPAPALISPQYGAPSKGNEKREELRTLRVFFISGITDYRISGTGHNPYRYDTGIDTYIPSITDTTAGC